MEETKTAFDWASIVAPLFTLLGIFVGSLSTYIINSKVEDKKHKYDNLKIKLSKLEDIYYRYEKWEVSFISYFDIYLKGIKEGFSKEELAQFNREKDTDASNNDLSENIKKLNAVINIYTPELIDDYSKVELSRDAIGNRIMKLSNEDTVILEELCSAFFRYSNDFKKSLRNLSNNLLETTP